MFQIEDIFAEDAGKGLFFTDWATSEKTIAQPIHCRDIGIHSGKPVMMRFEPAPAGTGIQFIREDIKQGDNRIFARWDKVEFTTLCTEISNDDNAVVATVEHVMSALAGKGIDNICIYVDGAELPIMDGSAKDFVFLLESAGIKSQSRMRKFIKILKPVVVKHKSGAYASLLPTDEWHFKLDMRINFPNSAIGEHKLSYRLDDDFAQAIAPARTYGFVSDLHILQSNGLACGASQKNAIALDGDNVLNKEGLRFDDEFVRHKILDAVGDLYLAGKPLIATFEGNCSGHKLNNELLRALFSDSDNWCMMSAKDYKCAGAVAFA